MSEYQHRLAPIDRCSEANIYMGYASTETNLVLDQTMLEKFRPVIPEAITRPEASHDKPCKKILILGTYLTNAQSNIDDIISTLSNSTKYHATQRWVALGGKPPTSRVANVTVKVTSEKMPKFRTINELLAEEDLVHYEHILIMDDDVVLPQRFLDNFVSLQENLTFAIAQPAQTSNSYISYPIVERQRGVLARQTLFVERNPVVSFHSSIYNQIFPFDMANPIGWGYENVWSYLVSQQGLKIGIIDVVPVNRSLRRPVAYQDWERIRRERSMYLRAHDHLSDDQCFTVIDAILSSKEVE